MGDLCVGAFQEERGMASAVFTENNNNNGSLPVCVAPADVPGSLYELAIDAIPVFGESFGSNNGVCNFPFQQQQQQQPQQHAGSGFGFSPLPWQVNLDPALVLCDPLWRHQQRAKFESPAGGLDAVKMHYRGMNSFEERQASLADLLLGSGYNNNCSNLLHEQTCEALQSVLENNDTLQVADRAINLCGVYVNGNANADCNGNASVKAPKLEPDGEDNSIYYENCFSPLLANGTEASLCSGLQQQDRDKAEGDSTLSCHGGGSWQCAITNQLLGYDTLPELHTVNAGQLSDSYRLVAMPHNVFRPLSPPSHSNSASPSVLAPKQNVQHLQHEAQLIASWPNHLYRSKPLLESFGTGSVEPPAKRPRTSCYTLNDILKNLPRAAQHQEGPLGLRRPLTVRSNESSPRTICPAPQFSSDVNLSSPRQLSSSSLEKDSDERPSARPAASVEPQSVAARHRRKKISEKIRCLEKLIPGGCKLDTARMLDEAIKYVRFLQAQVHVLECMSFAEPKDSSMTMRPFSAGLFLDIPSSCKNALRSPSYTNSNDTLLAVKGSSSASAGSCNISRNVRSALAAKSLLKKLSTQQMLHILVTSPTLQRKLYTAEKCVGTEEQSILLAAAESPLSYDLISSADFPSQKG